MCRQIGNRGLKHALQGAAGTIALEPAQRATGGPTAGGTPVDGMTYGKWLPFFKQEGETALPVVGPRPA